jgi:hypothetical protein
MTPSGQIYIEISDRELREIRWRAFLAGFDARDTRDPLEEAFARWLEHESNEALDDDASRLATVSRDASRRSYGADRDAFGENRLHIAP